MTHPATRFLALSLVAVACAVGTAAWAAPEAVNVRSGGATVEEFEKMKGETGPHMLSLVMAAKGSGAYLADVDVTLRALPSREVVMEHRAQGPLLLATLPPGRYELTAQYKDVKPGAQRAQTRIVTIGESTTKLVLYFDTGDDLSPDNTPAYRTN